jgi:signal transduction histidine kinase
VRRLLIVLALLAFAGSFGAIGLALALVGAGVPYLVATAFAALLAGIAAYAALLALVARPLAPLGPEAPGVLAQSVTQQRTRLATLETLTSSLRHDLRGLLSPAMLVSDRLLAHSDPKVVRSGETIVRSITRASERLAATRAPQPEAASGQESQPVLPGPAPQPLDPATPRAAR